MLSFRTVTFFVFALYLSSRDDVRIKAHNARANRFRRALLSLPSEDGDTNDLTESTPEVAQAAAMTSEKLPDVSVNILSTVRAQTNIPSEVSNSKSTDAMKVSSEVDQIVEERTSVAKQNAASNEYSNSSPKTALPSDNKMDFETTSYAGEKLPEAKVNVNALSESDRNAGYEDFSAISKTSSRTTAVRPKMNVKTSPNPLSSADENIETRDPSLTYKAEGLTSAVIDEKALLSESAVTTIKYHKHHSGQSKYHTFTGLVTRYIKQKENNKPESSLDNSPAAQKIAGSSASETTTKALDEVVKGARLNGAGPINQVDLKNDLDDSKAQMTGSSSKVQSVDTNQLDGAKALSDAQVTEVKTQANGDDVQMINNKLPVTEGNAPAEPQSVNA